jgi:hypothetical protein
MEDSALVAETGFKDIKDVPAGLAVVDDDRKLQRAGYIQLVDEQLDLRVLVAIVAIIIQTDLPDGYHPFEFGEGLEPMLPVLARIGYLGGRHSHSVVYIGRGFEIFIHMLKIDKAIAYADDMRHRFPLRELDD